MMRGRTTSFWTAMLTCLVLVGCADRADDPARDADTAAGALPPGHVPISSAPEGAQATRAVTVTVLETMDGGGYTYARVDVDGEEAWLAGPQAELEVGETVAVTDLMTMENFTSGSLDRTFEVIYFVEAFQAPGSPGMEGGPPGDLPRGTVAEVLTGGGYVYLHVALEGDSVWLAGPMAQVSEGQVVEWRGGMTMQGFESGSLERTFDEILFVEEVRLVR